MRLWILGLTLVVSATWAAESELAPVFLHQLPWVSIVIAGIIAIWGGLTRTTTRHLTRGEVLAMAFKDSFIAAGCGFVAFNLASWAQLNIWLMATVIYIAGWLGAKFLSAVSDRILEAIRTAGRTEK